MTRVHTSLLPLTDLRAHTYCSAVSGRQVYATMRVVVKLWPTGLNTCVPNYSGVRRGALSYQGGPGSLVV